MLLKVILCLIVIKSKRKSSHTNKVIIFEKALLLYITYFPSNFLKLFIKLRIHLGLILHMWHWCPVWLLGGILAAVLRIQLPANGLRRQQRIIQVLGSLNPYESDLEETFVPQPQRSSLKFIQGVNQCMQDLSVLVKSLLIDTQAKLK